MTDSKEAALLVANQRRAAITAELQRLGPAAPRTLRDRQRWESLQAEQVAVEKELSDLRRWLKAHGGAA